MIFKNTKAERPSIYYDYKCSRVHMKLDFQVWACKLKYVQIINTWASFIENKILQKLG